MPTIEISMSQQPPQPLPLLPPPPPPQSSSSSTTTTTLRSSTTSYSNNDGTTMPSTLPQLETNPMTTALCHRRHSSTSHESVVVMDHPLMMMSSSSSSLSNHDNLNVFNNHHNNDINTTTTSTSPFQNDTTTTKVLDERSSGEYKEEIDTMNHHTHPINPREENLQSDVTTSTSAVSATASASSTIPTLTTATSLWTTEEATVLLDTQYHSKYNNINGDDDDDDDARKLPSKTVNGNNCINSNRSRSTLSHMDHDFEVATTETDQHLVAPNMNDVSASFTSRLPMMVTDYDARYAATMNEEEELLLAMKISAYESRLPQRSAYQQINRYYSDDVVPAAATSTITLVPGEIFHQPSLSTPEPYTQQSLCDSNSYIDRSQNAQHATVVEISAHFDDPDHRSVLSSSMSPFYLSAMSAAMTTTTTNPTITASRMNETVQAEWIGSSSMTTAAASPHSNTQMIYATAATSTTAAVVATSAVSSNDSTNDDFHEDTYYEVAVIDSAPMEKQDETIGYTEEARIVDIREQHDNDSPNAIQDDDDRKPAAVRRPKKKPNRSNSTIQQPLPYVSNRQLHVISEHHEVVLEDDGIATTAEVVSIQMDSDLHPLQRSTDNDYEAELVGHDHTFYTNATVNNNEYLITARNYNDTHVVQPNNAIFASTSIDGMQQPDRTANIISIQDDDAIHPADLDAFGMEGNVSASAEFVGSTDDLNHSNSTIPDQAYPMAISTLEYDETPQMVSVVPEQEGDVIMVRNEDDVHPLEFEESTVGCTNAELIGSIDSLNLNSIIANEDRGSTSTIAMALTTESSTTTADIVLVESNVPDDSVLNPIIIATAFTDPHQPLIDSTAVSDEALWDANEDEEIARTLQEAEDVAQTLDDDVHAAAMLQDEDVARQLQSMAESDQSGVGSINHDGAVSEFTESLLSEALQTPVHTHEQNIANENTPEPHKVSQTTREISRDSTASGSENTTSSHNLGNSISTSIGRGTTIVLEALFGDLSPLGIRRPNTSDSEHVRHIVPRTLLPCSVIHNPATNMWVATIQTNQKALDEKNVAEASKSLRAFTMPSERQARSLARSWTPPRMHRFADSRFCHICKSRFALLRRACHCRNCGVCVCKDCSVTWPAKMIPDTYNFKKESVVNACRSCDWLSTSFRLALLQADHDRAVSLFSTGNVNLHTPFANVKGELFYPVHCAVLGGNLDLLKFLVDENCCPIRSIRVAGNTKDTSNKVIPIVTSKGRSLLGIAMEGENLNMVRYLVADKGLSLSNEKDLTHELLCRNLEKLLRLTPDNNILLQMDGGDRRYDPMNIDTVTMLQSPTAVSPRTRSSSSSQSIDNDSTTGSIRLNNDTVERNTSITSSNNSTSSNHTNIGPSTINNESQPPPVLTTIPLSPADTIVMDMPPPLMPPRVGFQQQRRRSSHGLGTNQECIICFDHIIDCVATPCGHSVCCLKCSSHLNVCPVCNGPSTTFIKIFRA